MHIDNRMLDMGGNWANKRMEIEIGIIVIPRFNYASQWLLSYVNSKPKLRHLTV